LTRAGSPIALFLRLIFLKEGDIMTSTSSLDSKIVRHSRSGVPAVDCTGDAVLFTLMAPLPIDFILTTDDIIGG
jgi:hypothetical protein